MNAPGGYANQTTSNDAVNELRQLVDRYPQEPQFKAILAEVLLRTGQKDSGIIIARQALQDADFGLPADDQSNLHLLTGRYYRNSGQLDNAIHHLKSAIDAFPTNMDAHLELGFTYQERRQYTQAYKVFQAATHVSPSDYRPYYHAGIVLKESKDYQTAEEMLRKASELSPENPTINRQFGAVVALNLVHNRRFSKRISQNL